MSSAAGPIETKKVVGRRQLHFESMEELLADASSFGPRGPSRTLGNWSAGAIVDHVAILIGYSVDGFPPETRVPAFVRLIGPLLRRLVTTKPMKPGFVLAPSMSALLPRLTEWPEGLAHLERRVDEFKRATDLHPSPFLGSMTREQWTSLHLRHAELHFSFMI